MPGCGRNRPMTSPTYSAAHIRGILERVRTIAAVGVSLNDVRPSYYVTRYLSLKGYKVIPVNPRYAGGEAFGQPVYASLAEIPRAHDPIDMVEIFRRSEEAGGVVDEAIEHLLDRGLKVIWMQIGIVNREAAARAEAKGLTVIMNHCPKIEYQRHWGELRWGGINTGVISSKLS